MAFLGRRRRQTKTMRELRPGGHGAQRAIYALNVERAAENIGRRRRTC